VKSRSHRSIISTDQLQLDFGGAPRVKRDDAPASTHDLNVEIATGPLDDRFAELMARLNGSSNPVLATAARAVSAWRAAGHICFPLGKLFPGQHEIASTLLSTKVVGRPGEWKPLILDHAGRLYLQRYWQYEHQLAAAIRQRLGGTSPQIDEDALQRGLDAWFDPFPSEQRAAAHTAITSNVSVITGGPGTGKTRTIAGILALLYAQARTAGSDTQIALAAPTGKAAARMTESIRHALQQFPEAFLQPTSASTETEAVTLHRLLGITPDSPIPRFDARHPLPVSTVIVDEASMIDLALMAKLFAAVPTTARIILLGDKDQLASVEAGHVLGDICEAGNGNSTLQSRIVELRKSYRFLSGGGIYELGKKINSGNAGELLDLLHHPPTGITSLALPSSDTMPRFIRERAVSGFRKMLETSDPHDALRALSEFRVLCAVRQGRQGVVALNMLCEQALTKEHLIVPGPLHYHGRPIMILRNDYTLRLFNGDTGILLRDPESDGELRAFFFNHDGALRKLSPARLPEHETVWAMTVHKSQGSEFDRVLFILPDHDTPLLTRELIYTAVTRARSSVELWFSDSILRQAISRRTERVSGLGEKLGEVRISSED
jgi:exodeoxyribonuclease V alpha subunit